VTGVLASDVASVVSTVAGLDGSKASLQSIAVSDSAANVLADLSALNAQSKVTSIAITSGTGTLQGVASIAAATLSVTGSGTLVKVAESLAYSGTFNEGVGATIKVALGDTLTLSGTTTLAGAVSGAGALELHGATFDGGAQSGVISAALINDGKLAVASGSLDISGAISGTGRATIADGASLEVDSTVGTGESLNFGTAGGELILDDLDIGGSQLFHGTVGGFAAGDTLDVGASFGAGTVLKFTENAGLTAGTLTLANGSASASITLNGDFVAADFHTQLSGGATLITYHT